jgi:NAD(P)-dependent dehydrogenase (short-subunit alcohol dehydrogenase family)/acyl carrier protein
MEGLNAIPPLSESENPETEVREHEPKKNDGSEILSTAGTLGASLEAISALLDETLEKATPKDFITPRRPFDRNEPAAGSVVISGTGFSISSEGQRPLVGDGDFDLIAELIATAAMGALKDGGIPLIEQEDNGLGGELGSGTWILPQPLRQETGVITAPSYPDHEDLLRIQEKYDTYKRIVDQLKVVNQANQATKSERSEQVKVVVELMRELAADSEDGQDPYLTLGALAHDYSQLAGDLGAQGPVAHLRPGGACASEAISLADDWIRTGRCRRVVIVCTTEMVGDGLNNWLDGQMGFAGTATGKDGSAGSGEQQESNKLSAFALLMESEDALSERGMRGIVELLGSETLPHTSGSERDLIDHVAGGMERLVDGAERRFVLYRAGMAPHLVFLTSEAAYSRNEVPIGIAAFESVFGAAAKQAIVTSAASPAKNGPGSALGAAIAIKILESGIVPHAPVDWLEIPALDSYRFGNGNNYEPLYLLYLAGLTQSRVAMNLFRLISREIVRVDDLKAYHRWVESISGYEQVFVEAGDKMLRLVGQKVAGRKPQPSGWQYGLGPTLLAQEGDLVPLTAASEMTVERPDQQEVLAVEEGVEDELPPDAALLLEKGFDVLDIKILMIAAKFTGIALKNLDLDQDLKSDLGMTEQEHAELLIDICQEFDVSGFVNLNTGHYPTLAHMIALVRGRRPDLLLSKAKGDLEERPETAFIPIIDGTLSRGQLITAALEIVSNKTGYTVDMLMRSLDLLLDEELGIDAVEKREVFQVLCQAFKLEIPESHQLIDYPTLSHIIDYLLTSTGDDESPDGLPLVAASSAVIAASSIMESPVPVSKETVGAGPPIEFAISDTVLMIAGEHVGVPSDRLDVAANMVDDLGLDEKQQEEIVSAVLDSFGIPQPQGLHPSDFPSVGALIVFVRMSRPDLLDTQLVRAREAEAELADVDGAFSTIVEEAEIHKEPILVDRYVASPSQLPPLIECYATDISLAGKRVVVMSDRGGVSDELASQLLENGVTVLPLSATIHFEELEERILSWLEDGPIDGVYWLPALDSEPAMVHMSLDTWRELNRQKLKNFHRTMRVLNDSINHQGSFLVTATRMGGLHGFGYSDVTSPLGGSVTGFAKAFKLEQERSVRGKQARYKVSQGQYGSEQIGMSQVGHGTVKPRSSPLVKVIDFEVDRDDWDVAQALIAETIADPETVEVGYIDNQRHGVTLVEIAPSNGEPGLTLNEESVYLVTGASRRVTGEIVAALSKKGGTFYLLDTAAAPNPDNPRLELLRTDKRALREQLVEEIHKAVSNPTSSMVDKLVRAIEREDRVLWAIDSVEQNGASAVYACVDLLNFSALRTFINDVHRKHGRIDVLVHAAGLENTRTLPDKDPVRFDLVYDVKADGFYNLLRASQAAPPRSLVVFGSMETRHGSWGRCDSSAANELLRKVIGSLAWQQPDTRGLAVSWIAEGKNSARSDSPGEDSRSYQPTDFSFIRRELEASDSRGEVIFQLDNPPT